MFEQVLVTLEQVWSLHLSTHALAMYMFERSFTHACERTRTRALTRTERALEQKITHEKKGMHEGKSAHAHVTLSH